MTPRAWDGPAGLVLPKTSPTSVLACAQNEAVGLPPTDVRKDQVSAEHRVRSQESETIPNYRREFEGRRFRRVPGQLRSDCRQLEASRSPRRPQAPIRSGCLSSTGVKSPRSTKSPLCPTRAGHRSPRDRDAVRSGLDLASGPWQNRVKTPHLLKSHRHLPEAASYVARC